MFLIKTFTFLSCVSLSITYGIKINTEDFIQNNDTKSEEKTPYNKGRVFQFIKDTNVR